MWIKKEQQEKESFKDIIELQRKEERRNLEKDVGNRNFAEKEQMINTVERNKCAVVFGDTEEDQPVTNIRKKGELGRARETIIKVNDEEDK